jgi:uncharacterized repeat protein (TIGR04052 family)
MRSSAVLAAVILLTACTRHAGDPVTIAFAAELSGAPFRCGAPVALDGAKVLLVDLRLYVHDLELVDSTGRASPVTLDDDGSFQTTRVAMLDFEDASGACRNGSPQLHTALHGRAAGGQYVALRGVIGVPFDLNHGDPATDPPALAPTAMQWSWLSGHTFLRFEAHVNDRPVRAHMGSEGCTGDMGNVAGCKFPNRARFEVPLPHGLAAPVRFDLTPLLRAALAGGPESRGCMGAPDDPGCAAVYDALGLSRVDGTATGKVRGLGPP